MKAKLAAVAVALLLVGTGAAVAAPGNAPADTPAQTDATANETDGDAAENETDANGQHGPPADVPAQADNDSHGPPTDMPDQAPDFVSDIHDAVGAHLNGSFSGAELGDRIQSVVPGGEDAQNEGEEAAEDESGEETDENETADDAEDDETRGPPSDSPAPDEAGQ
jgi:hypothetical protein